MSLAAIIGAITALGGIAGAFIYVFKYSTWAFSKSLDAKKQDIGAAISNEQKKEEETGRPQ